MDFLQYIHELFSYGNFRDGGILFENCISLILKNNPTNIKNGIKYYNTNDNNDIKELQNDNINICIIGGQSKGIDGIIKLKNDKYMYIQIKFSCKNNNKPDLTEFYKIFTNNKDKRFINKGILICNFKYTSDDNLYVYDNEHIVKWFSTHNKLLSISFVKNINNGVKTKDNKINDVKTKDNKINDTKVKDVKTNDTKVKDVKAKDVKNNDNKIKDVKNNEVKAKDNKNKVKDIDVKNKVKDTKNNDTKTKDNKNNDTKVKDTKTNYNKVKDNKNKVKDIDDDKMKYIKEDILLYKKFHDKYNRFIKSNEKNKIGIYDINGNRLNYIKKKIKNLDEYDELIVFIQNNYIELYNWYITYKLEEINEICEV